ncbi:MAG: ABC transporter permease [Dehalococcoidia bacterium]|nr:ABC transporter permease [Dehalococcoidia bacterium]MCB9486601.1 ABC transporter permease [Thermoflexaceae bacterium]
MAQQPAAGAIDLADEGVQKRRLPFYVDVLRRLVKEKPIGLFGGILVVIIALAALFANVVAPFGANELGAGGRLDSPALGNIFGTDNLGRDVFSRVVYGARVSMWIGLLAVTASTTLSLSIGVLSGYFGGWIDLIAQRIVDAFIAFPGLIFLLSIIAVFRDSSIPGLPRQGLLSTQIIVLIISIGILQGVGASRTIRSAVLGVKSAMYVEAARSIGATHSRMIFVHIVPNIMAPVITLATLGFGSAILLEASLSFLGFGVPPDVPSWGGMLNREARSFMSDAPWLALAPGLTLSLAVFGFNMLGDALRDLLDPRMRGSGHGNFA